MVMRSSLALYDIPEKIREVCAEKWLNEAKLCKHVRKSEI